MNLWFRGRPGSTVFPDCRDLRDRGRGLGAVRGRSQLKEITAELGIPFIYKVVVRQGQPFVPRQPARPGFA